MGVQRAQQPQARVYLHAFTEMIQTNNSNNHRCAPAPSAAADAGVAAAGRAPEMCFFSCSLRAAAAARPVPALSPGTVPPAGQDQFTPIKHKKMIIPGFEQPPKPSVCVTPRTGCTRCNTEHLRPREHGLQRRKRQSIKMLLLLPVVLTCCKQHCISRHATGNLLQQLPAADAPQHLQPPARQPRRRATHTTNLNSSPAHRTGCVQHSLWVSFSMLSTQQ